MIKLETLLSSIAASVQSSQAAIQQNAYKNFLQYFKTASPQQASLSEQGSSSELVPILDHFKLPGMSDDKDFAVPVVTLINQDSLVLDTVKVVLNVSGISEGEHFMVNTEPINNENNLEHHQITLEFQRKDPTEGTSRVLTTYEQLI